MSKEVTINNEFVEIGRQGIVFIGPEGSGKSTIAKDLAKKSGKPYISTGDILRDTAENNLGELGDAVRKMFAENAYLSSEKLLDILEIRLRREDVKNGFILDGGLRKVEETLGFPDMLKRAAMDIPLTVIHLRVPGWMAMDRLVRVRKRGDDTVEGALERLRNFYLGLGTRASIIQSQKDWKFVHVDATGSPQEVFNLVKCVVEESK